MTMAETSRLPEWQVGLEDGPLRSEMGLPPKYAEPGPARPMVFDEALVFHGQGEEYFRIWSVNLFLCLITLGLYSPWAKVRKARWFAQNTSLAGHHFDFHGDPKRILVGRLVALGLLALWTVSFEMSAYLGLLVLALFCVLGPLLFASAQRFRLTNTSWRGLRFGFDVPTPLVYQVCVPLLLIWTLASVAQALKLEDWVVSASAVAFLALPLAHGRLKQLQHHWARFGDMAFQFDLQRSAFYGLYAKAVAFALVGAVFGALIVFGSMAVVAQSSSADVAPGMVKILLSSLGVGMAMWLMAWPYFAARMQQLVWGNTRMEDIRFTGTMKGAALWRLVMLQTVGVLLTCGLYWPFAAVAIARYRVQAVRVQSPVPLSDTLATAVVPEKRAIGDGVAESFGLDLGW